MSWPDAAVSIAFYVCFAAVAWVLFSGRPLIVINRKPTDRP